ncbi:MAG TPA: AlpA family phage regulatory protein [Stellaceae bacterium]|nr:AlpA family phage regulatory protein [Stellaceae bacterium]
MSREETSDFISQEFGSACSYTKATLAKLAHTGGGPKFVKIGERRVGYRKDDVRQWIRSQMRIVESTSDHGADL